MYIQVYVSREARTLGAACCSEAAAVSPSIFLAFQWKQSTRLLMVKSALLFICTSMVIASLGACATISPGAASSGAIGCAEHDIKISDDDEGLSTRTWKAECHGKRYFCSGTAGPPNHVSCTQDNTAAQQASPPRSEGCQYDGQCKGSRVCRDHQCVDS